MRIYTKAGDLAFKTFTFPDGQPHFKLETYESEFRDVTIETAIRNPTELFEALLASDVLRRHGYSDVRLDVRYLMAARMDRAIDWAQPFSLDLVARLINGAGFSKVRLLDVHSEVSTRLIRNSVNVLPMSAIRQVLTTLGGVVRIIIPDKGAEWRVATLTHDYLVRTACYAIQCTKERDPATGKLSKFEVHNPSAVAGSEVLIIDDICDGGGTFVGLAAKLREAGATKVFLYITHGIFSKGLPLDGIDHVYTTDSYCKCAADWDAAKRGQDVAEVATIIPISMKELK